MRHVVRWSRASVFFLLLSKVLAKQSWDLHASFWQDPIHLHTPRLAAVCPFERSRPVLGSIYHILAPCASLYAVHPTSMEIGDRLTVQVLVLQCPVFSFRHMGPRCSQLQRYKWPDCSHLCTARATRPFIVEIGCICIAMGQKLES